MSGTLAGIRTKYLRKSRNSYSKLRNKMERIQLKRKQQTFLRHDG
jgi:hypothetical protein